MKVAAALLLGVGQEFVIDQVDLDGPKSHELLVKITASGLCASDLNAIDGKRKLVPFPAIIGHEAAGIVHEVGPGVTRFQPGDRVILSIVPSCGTCMYCEMGQPNYCLTAGDAMSVGGLLDGTSRLSYKGEKIHHFLTVSSFAEFAVVPESGAVKVPENMPLDRAALISCAVLTGYGAVANTAKVPAGSRVAVFGCGGVGLNVLQGARIAGASKIIAVDVNAEKLALARRVGATDVVNAAETDPVAYIKNLCGGVDYSFEALGREETIQQAWLSLDVFGQAILVGLMKHGSSLTIASGPFVNEQSIKGCYFGSANLNRDVPDLVNRYLSGELLLDEIISDRVGLDGLNDAVARLRAGEGARNVLVFD